MERRNQSFQRLKPPCVKLSQAALSFAASKQDSKFVIQDLSDLLQVLKTSVACENGLDEKLADYVFFPISHVLRETQALPARALELSLQCLAILLKNGWRDKIASNLSGQLLILLTFLSGGGDPGKKLGRTSEDLQVAAFHCLSLLFGCLSQTSSGRDSFVSTANVPQLGHTLSNVLDGCVDGSSNGVQISALEALDNLTRCVEDVTVLANFLPGIVSSLTKVLIPSSKSRRSNKVLEDALMILRRLLSTALGNARIKDLPEKAASDVNDPDSRSPLTKSWVQATSGQVKQALAGIIRQWNHDRENVRRALSELCATVLDDCKESLAESANMMLETLVMLSDKDDTSGSGNNTLKRLLILNPNLCELLRESLRSWIISLPRIMESNDDAAKQRVIHRISLGHALLSEQTIDLTSVDAILTENLRDSVTYAIKEQGLITQAQDNEFTARAVDVATTDHEGRLVVFNNVLESRRSQKDTITEIQSLVQRLSTSSSAESLIQDLIQSCNTSAGADRVASFWLAIQTLKGNSGVNLDLIRYLDFGGVDLQQQLVDHLYSLSLDILSSAEGDELDWKLPALAMEVVALQAQQQKMDFRDELVDALYLVVQYVGSQVEPLRRHAMTCLNLIANRCGYSSAGELIVSNVDYLTNAVSFKLSGPEISPQAPMVLLMMIRLSGPPLIPYLDDVVGSIFVALDQYHGYPKLVELLFAVLRAVAEESVKAPQLAVTAKTAEIKALQPVQTLTAIHAIGEIRRLKDKSQSLDIPTESEDGTSFPRRPWKEESGKKSRPSNLMEEISLPLEDDDGESDLEPEEPADPGPPAPKTYNLLLSISRLTQHYLSSSSPNLQLSLLSLLNIAIPAIACHENSFLPLINTLWPVIVSRLEDSGAYVVTNALLTTSSLCRYAGNFMKGRIEDLWPSILEIYNQKVLNDPEGVAAIPDRRTTTLSQQGTDLVLRELSLQRNPSTVYVDATTRAIWDGLVNFFVVVASHVPVSEEIFDDMLRILGPTIIDRMDIRQALERRNPDAVWLAVKKRETQAALDNTKSDLIISLGSGSDSSKPKTPCWALDRGWKFADALKG
ncbi:MAG: hypothetical protein M1820_009161 [Bogoriella megaspora]|nr:MAG: hypothetical protein M1820_009161 [Bogoriella megaspora]